jgi:hypothetical protein
VTKLTPLLNWQQKIGIYMLDVVPSLTQEELGSGTLSKRKLERFCSLVLMAAGF